MPRKLRRPKVQRAVEGVLLSPEELTRRAQWGGVFGDVPPLTVEQRWAFISLHCETWVPQRALGHLWETIDDEESWSAAAALAKLDEDASDEATFLTRHPEQRERLARWHDQMQMLILQRDQECDQLAWRAYYQRLSALGYDTVFGRELGDGEEACDDDG